MQDCEFMLNMQLMCLFRAGKIKFIFVQKKGKTVNPVAMQGLHDKHQLSALLNTLQSHHSAIQLRIQKLGRREEEGGECILHFHAENSMNEGVDDAEVKSLYLLQISCAAASVWFSVTQMVEV